MKSIYVVRHGQTDYNLKKVVQGRTDILLNETGIKEANDTAIKLKDIDFDVVVTSPLKRAHKTALIINEYNSCNNLIVEEDIIERCFGYYEKKLFKLLIESDDPYVHDDYERDEVMHERINNAINKYINEYDTICFVSHSHVLKEIIMYYEPEMFINSRIFYLPNCAIMKLNFDEDNNYINLEFIDCEPKKY